MNDRQRIIELERQLRNMTQNGKVTAVQANQVKVAISNSNAPEPFVTGWLPLLGRAAIEVGELVLVVVPNANPAVGYVIPVLPDPKIREQDEKIAALQQQLEQLQQQLSSWYTNAAT